MNVSPSVTGYGVRPERTIVGGVFTVEASAVNAPLYISIVTGAKSTPIKTADIKIKTPPFKSVCLDMFSDVVFCSQNIVIHYTTYIFSFVKLFRVFSTFKCIFFVVF